MSQLTLVFFCVCGFLSLGFSLVRPLHLREFPACRLLAAVAHSHDLVACGCSSYLILATSNVKYCTEPPELDRRFEEWEIGKRHMRLVLYSNLSSTGAGRSISPYLRHCFVTNPEEGSDSGVTVLSVATRIYENNGQRRPDTSTRSGRGFVMGKTIMYKNVCSYGMTQSSPTCRTPQHLWGIVHCEHCACGWCSNILSDHLMAGTPHRWGIVQYGRYTYGWCRNMLLLQKFSSVQSNGTVLVSSFPESRSSISERISLDSMFSGSAFSFMLGPPRLALSPSVGQFFAFIVSVSTIILDFVSNRSPESFSISVAVVPSCSLDTTFPYRVFPDFYGLLHGIRSPLFGFSVLFPRSLLECLPDEGLAVADFLQNAISVAGNLDPRNLDQYRGSIAWIHKQQQLISGPLSDPYSLGSFLVPLMLLKFSQSDDPAIRTIAEQHNLGFGPRHTL